MTFTESRPYEWDAYLGREVRRYGITVERVVGGCPEACAITPGRKTSSGFDSQRREARDRELADRAALRRARVESFFNVWGEK